MARRLCPYSLPAVLLCAVLFPERSAAQSRAAAIDSLLREADRLASQQVRRAQDAVPLYRRAISIANAGRDVAREADALTGLGSALRSTNRPSEAEAALERAITLARRVPRQATEAEALRLLGILRIEMGEHARAELALLRGLAVARESAHADAAVLGTHIGILNSLSVGARHQGRLRDATRHAENALRLLDGAAQMREVPEVLLFQVPFNVGKSLAEAGDYSSALSYFDRAFRAAQASGNKGGQWHALFDTAEWYLAQGEIDRAARYHERAYALSRTMDSRDMEAHSLRGRGAVAELQGNTPAAIQFYTAALTLMDRIRLLWDTPETLVARARLRFAAGDRAGADQDVRGALGRAARAHDHTGRAHAHLELARQQLASGDIHGAVAEHTRALTLARVQGVRPLVPIALMGLGHAARAQGDLVTAARWYRSSLGAAATILGRIPSLDLRTAFTEAIHSTYAALVAVLLQLHRTHPAAGYAREALMVVERERSQNLIQALDWETFDGGVRERPAVERDREGQLRVGIAELQTALLSDGTAANRNHLLARLDDAERALEALRGRKAQSRSVGSLEDAPQSAAADIAAMQRTLHADEALIEFAMAGSERFAFVVDRDRMEVVALPYMEALDARVDSFNRLLKTGMSADAIPAGRALARVFLEPILPRLRRETRVLLLGVAGTAAAIPFAALPILDEAGRATPLIARYDLAFVPSLSVLSHLRRRPPTVASEDLLAFADPGKDAGDRMRSFAAFRSFRVGALPYSGLEVQAIARYAADPVVLVGPAASESAFKTRREGFRVLHFATHALVDAKTPSRSALLLAGSATEDGLLQPEEIHRQGRRAEMVVLSACQSAGGRVSSAEGVLSLARAFMYGGARSVVGSQWDVTDRSSAKLVARFYGQLARGHRVAAALREAQLEIAGKTPYANAADWAGFIIAGDPRADPKLRQNSLPAVPLTATMASAVVALLALFGGSRLAVRATVPPRVSPSSVETR